MLKQHRYYVYHDGATVFARMEDKAPVVIAECASPQAAADKVQSIINPLKLKHEDLHKGDLEKGTADWRGFRHPDFQNAISGNCEKAVKAAYAAKK